VAAVATPPVTTLRFAAVQERAAVAKVPRAAVAKVPARALGRNLALRRWNLELRL
jgi:hypothetical protein